MNRTRTSLYLLLSSLSFAACTREAPDQTDDDDGSTSTTGGGGDATSGVGAGGVGGGVAPVICGDGIVDEETEACDDGNTTGNDGCADGCYVEDGFTCAHDGGPSICTPICGDTRIVPGEECDDGDAFGGDGCDSACQVEDGWVCQGLPSMCDALVREVRAGQTHSCALKYDGRVRCWGTGTQGQLGYGNTDVIGDDEDPVVAGDVYVGAKVSQIALGYFTCALTDLGNVRCWGSGAYGQLGHGNTNDLGDDESPAGAGDIPLGGKAVQVTVGRRHACAVLDDGNLRCWGWSFSGVLGYGNLEAIGDDETPASAGNVPVGEPVVQVSAGTYHTCAVTQSGGVRCWGDALSGALGYGNNLDVGDDETPASVGDVAIGGIATKVVAGEYSTCALLQGGTVKCWGGDYPDLPTTVTIGFSPVDITGGGAHVCALSPAGDMRCWGDNGFGQLGLGDLMYGFTTVPSTYPILDMGGATTLQVSSGRFHSCAVTQSDEIYCWGAAALSRLGIPNGGNIGDDESPVSGGPVSVF